MKEAPVRVVAARRPASVPAKFIDWQFALVKARILPDELEDEICRSISKLLFAYLPLQLRKPLKNITRAEAQSVADDINQHCENLISIAPYLRRKLAEVAQGES